VNGRQAGRGRTDTAFPLAANLPRASSTAWPFKSAASVVSSMTWQIQRHTAARQAFPGLKGGDIGRTDATVTLCRQRLPAGFARRLLSRRGTSRRRVRVVLCAVDKYRFGYRSYRDCSEKRDSFRNALQRRPKRLRCRQSSEKTGFSARFQGPSTSEGSLVRVQYRPLNVNLAEVVS
jgi:hypothetical protein